MICVLFPHLAGFYFKELVLIIFRILGSFEVIVYLKQFFCLNENLLSPFRALWKLPKLSSLILEQEFSLCCFSSLLLIYLDIPRSAVSVPHLWVDKNFPRKLFMVTIFRKKMSVKVQWFHMVALARTCRESGLSVVWYNVSCSIPHIPPSRASKMSIGTITLKDMLIGFYICKL